MNLKKLLSLIFVFIYLSIPLLTAAQEKVCSIPLAESGFKIGYGTGNLKEGNYEPILLTWHLGYDVKNIIPDLANHSGILTCFLEPQINPVFERETDIEVGIGIGLKYTYPLSDYFSPYVFGSVGPHYISVQTNDQANGFIFADTVGFGLSIPFIKISALYFEYRLRHLSNAGLKDPNSGINTHFGTVGISFIY